MANTKKFLLRSIFCLSLCYSALFAQKNTIDSLMNVIQTSAEDTNKVNTLILLATEMVISVGDYDKTMEYADQAISLAQKIDYKKGHARALNIKGAAFMFQGKYTEALDNYTASLEIRELMGDKKGIASAYSNIGLVYMYQGDYSKSLKNHKASLKIEKEIDDKAGIAGSYNNIGIIYEDLGNYPEALNNYLASLSIKEEIGDKKGKANTLSNIGAIKELQRNFQEALMYHMYSLKIRQEIEDNRGIADCYNNIGNTYKAMGNYKEALKNNFASLKIYKETGNQRGISGCYLSIGQIYAAEGDAAILRGDKKFAINDRYPEALKNYLEALQIGKEIEDKGGVAVAYVNIGAVSIKLKKYADANKYLKDGLLVSQEIGNKKFIKESYRELALLDSAQGDFRQAFEDHKMYIVYRDSLFNEENSEKAFQTQMQYEIEKDQLREAEAEKERIKSVKRRNQLEYTVILLIILLMIGAVMLLGSIKVPRAVAQGLSFVSLLLVFESILVFTDPYLDGFTGGAPSKKLAANIMLAVLIFPIHSALERRFKRRLKLREDAKIGS